MDNAEFWFFKAIKRINNNEYDIAINFLKQVLIKNKLNFESIYNLGTLYEKM